MKWLVVAQPLLTEEEEAEVEARSHENGGRGVRPVLAPHYFPVEAEDEMGAWQAARDRMIEDAQWKGVGRHEAAFDSAYGVGVVGNVPRDVDISVAPMRTARIRFSTQGSISGETWD